MRYHLLATAAAVACGVAAPAMADVVFIDGNLPVAGFTKSAAYKSGTAATVVQCANCGDPGKALDIAVTVTGTSGSGNAFSQAFVKNAFSYDPATQGAIGSVSASVDKDVILNEAVSNFGDTFRPTILQGGVYYIATVTGPTLNFGASGGASGYIDFDASGLTAASFLSYNFATNTFGSANPDFDGGNMLFGLSQLSTLNTSAGFVAEVRYDNLRFDIAPAAVPEVGSLALLGSALAGFAGLTLRWRDRAA